MTLNNKQKNDLGVDFKEFDKDVDFKQFSRDENGNPITPAPPTYSTTAALMRCRGHTATK